jgi:hypothetical protein
MHVVHLVNVSHWCSLRSVPRHTGDTKAVLQLGLANSIRGRHSGDKASRSHLAFYGCCSATGRSGSCVEASDIFDTLDLSEA